MSNSLISLARTLRVVHSYNLRGISNRVGVQESRLSSLNKWICPTPSSPFLSKRREISSLSFTTPFVVHGFIKRRGFYQHYNQPISRDICGLREIKGKTFELEKNQFPDFSGYISSNKSSGGYPKRFYSQEAQSKNCSTKLDDSSKKHVNKGPETTKDCPEKVIEKPNKSLEERKSKWRYRWENFEHFGQGLGPVVTGVVGGAFATWAYMKNNKLEKEMQMVEIQSAEIKIKSQKLESSFIAAKDMGLTSIKKLFDRTAKQQAELYTSATKILTIIGTTGNRMMDAGTDGDSNPVHKALINLLKKGVKVRLIVYDYRSDLKKWINPKYMKNTVTQAKEISQNYPQLFECRVINKKPPFHGELIDDSEARIVNVGHYLGQPIHKDGPNTIEIYENRANEQFDLKANKFGYLKAHFESIWSSGENITKVCLSLPRKPIKEFPKTLSYVVNRKKPLEKIHNYFFSKDKHVVAVVGDVFTGKSELAKQYANEFHAWYEHVWFVEAENWEKSLKELYSKYFPDQTLETSNAERMLNQIFSPSGGRKSLIIFNNTPKGFVASALKGSLPLGNDILLTSEERDWPSASTIILSDKEYKLTLKEGIEILRRSALTFFDKRQAREVVREFSHSPVLIALAGNYIKKYSEDSEDNEDGRIMKKYRYLYKSKLQKLRDSDIAQSFKNGEEEKLYVCVQMILDKINEQKQASHSCCNNIYSKALSLILHGSYLPSKGIRLDDLKRINNMNDDQIDESLEILELLIVKNRDNETTSISINKQFQKIIALYATLPDHELPSENKILDNLTSFLKDGGAKFVEFLCQDLDKAIKVCEHASKASSSDPNLDIQIVRLMIKIGKIYFDEGNYPDSEKYLLKSYNHCLNKDIKDKLFHLCRLKLGEVRLIRDNFGEAKKILDKLAEEIVDKNDYRDLYAKALTARSRALERLGEYKPSIEGHKEAIQIKEKYFEQGNERDLEIAESKHWYGWALSRAGLYKEAKEQIGESLKDLNRILKENHLKTLHVKHDCGMILRLLGEYDTAIGYFKDVRKERKKILGKDHVAYADCLHNLALALLEKDAKSKKDIEKAKKLFRKSLSINESTFARAHRTIPASIHCLANALVEQSDHLSSSDHEYKKLLLLEAVGLHEMALTLRESSPQLEKMYIAFSKYDLACALEKQGDIILDNKEDTQKKLYTKAKKLHEDALEIREKLFKGEYKLHPLIADSKLQLALVRKKLFKGEYKLHPQKLESNNERSIRNLISEAISIREKRFGNNHPKTIKARTELKRLIEE